MKLEKEKLELVRKFVPYLLWDIYCRSGMNNLNSGDTRKSHIPSFNLEGEMQGLTALLLTNLFLFCNRLKWLDCAKWLSPLVMYSASFNGNSQHPAVMLDSQ